LICVCPPQVKPTYQSWSVAPTGSTHGSVTPRSSRAPTVGTNTGFRGSRVKSVPVSEVASPSAGRLDPEPRPTYQT